MVVYNNVLAGAAGQGGAEDQTIERSLRFNNDDSAYLWRNPSSSGNRKTWTFSTWCKIATPEQAGILLNAQNGTTQGFANNFWILFYSGTLVVGDGSADYLNTTKLRDPNAWYHIVVACDTTQSSASDRLKIYINGVESAYTGDARSSISQNSDTTFNSTYLHRIGDSGSYHAYFDGYLAETHLVDGQALAPTKFGKYDENGIWNPLVYSGSHGTNGFYLDYSDNSSDSALGNDAAGSNNWTVNNITASAGQAVTVANATGALPVLNTTGDQGGTYPNNGARSDSNSSYLELAAPLNTLQDWSGNNRTIGGSGVSLSSSRYRFYGTSAYFDGGSQLTISNVSNIFDFGTGDFTIEIWVRPSSTSGDQYIISWECTGPNAGHAGFNIYNGSWRLGAFNNDLTGGSTGLAAGEWVHLAMARQGTTLRTFVNGALTGSHSNSDNMSSTTALTLGKYAGNANLRFTGYMQDLRVYKGVAKYTSAFTPPTFANAVAAAGTDSVLDSPTNNDDGTNISGNYCTWNYLQNGAGTISNGNLQLGGISSPGTGRCNGTMAVSSGKWYYELTLLTARYYTSAGIGQGDITTQYPGQDALSYAYTLEQGTTISNGQQPSYGDALNSAGDVLQVAFDLDNNKLFFGKNGTWMASSNPATGANPAFTLASGTYRPIARPYDSSGLVSANFGASGFAYTPPTGYKALCTQNLPDPTIEDSSTAMNVVTYTGDNNTSRTITTGLSPDLVWLKTRNNQGGDWSHRIFDTVRGIDLGLSPNGTNTEENRYTATCGGVHAFSSTGFTLSQSSGNVPCHNATGNSMVAWIWNAGSSTVSNTDGDITTNLRANPTAGQSIATYSGSGTNGHTIGHGLGVQPDLCIVKARNKSDNWRVYHSALGTGYTPQLDSSGASSTGANWQSISSTTLGLQNDPAINGSGYNYLAIFFAAVEGYSAFGSYTGNGSADGPFVWTGFRVRYLLQKRSDSSGSWAIKDAAREPFNVVDTRLYADSNAADMTQSSYHEVDFLSNGFKVRSPGGGEDNASGGIYLYAAFAENPFKYARAR